jgi:hypothetical protein
MAAEVAHVNNAGLFIKTIVRTGASAVLLKQIDDDMQPSIKRKLPSLYREGRSFIFRNQAGSSYVPDRLSVSQLLADDCNRGRL